MKFEKGREKTGGRKVGVKNKRTIIIEGIEEKAIEQGYQLYVDHCIEWMSSKDISIRMQGMEFFQKIFNFVLPKKIQQKIEAEIESDVTIKIDMSKF